MPATAKLIMYITSPGTPHQLPQVTIVQTNAPGTGRRHSHRPIESALPPCHRRASRDVDSKMASPIPSDNGRALAPVRNGRLGEGEGASRNDFIIRVILRFHVETSMSEKRAQRGCIQHALLFRDGDRRWNSPKTRNAAAPKVVSRTSGMRR